MAVEHAELSPARCRIWDLVVTAEPGRRIAFGRTDELPEKTTIINNLLMRFMNM